MKTNIAKAIINMSCMPCRDTLAHYTQLDRAQTLEQAVTEYIKDCFASTVREKTNEGRNKKMASTFSQTGEDPTFTVMGGDAVRLAITEDKSAPATYHAAVEPVFVAEDGTSHPALYITVVTDGKSGIRAIYAAYGSLYTAQGAVVPNPAEQFADLAQAKPAGTGSLNQYGARRLQQRRHRPNLVRPGSRKTILYDTLTERRIFHGGKNTVLYYHRNCVCIQQTAYRQHV